MKKLFAFPLFLVACQASPNVVTQEAELELSADASQSCDDSVLQALDGDDEDWEDLQTLFAYQYFYFHGQAKDGRQLVMSIVAPNIFDPRAYAPDANGIPSGTRNRSGASITVSDNGQQQVANLFSENDPTAVSFTASPWTLKINNNVITRTVYRGKRYYDVHVDTIDSATGTHAEGEFTFVASLPGLKIDDGSLFDNPATSDFQKTYVIMPTARMSGYITFTSAAGEASCFSFDDVSAYAEKTFGTVPLQTALDAFYWNQARMPNGDIVYVYHQTGTNSTEPGAVQRPDVDRVFVLNRHGKAKLAADHATFTIGAPGALSLGGIPLESYFESNANGYTVRVEPTAVTMPANPLLPTYARFASKVTVTAPNGKTQVSELESLGDHMIFRAPTR